MSGSAKNVIGALIQIYKNNQLSEDNLNTMKQIIAEKKLRPDIEDLLGYPRSREIVETEYGNDIRKLLAVKREDLVYAGFSDQMLVDLFHRMTIWNLRPGMTDEEINDYFE